MEKKILLTIMIFYTTLLQTAARTLTATILTDESLELKVSGHGLSIPAGREEYEPIPFSTFLKALTCNRTMYPCLLVRSLNMPGGYQQLKITVNLNEHDPEISYTYRATTIPANPDQSLFASCTCSNHLLRIPHKTNDAPYWIGRIIAESDSLPDEQKLRLANILNVTRSGKVLLTKANPGNLLIKYFDEPKK